MIYVFNEVGQAVLGKTILNFRFQVCRSAVILIKAIGYPFLKRDSVLHFQ